LYIRDERTQIFWHLHPQICMCLQQLVS